MNVVNKQSCPTCGQSVNEREIALFSSMVQTLIRVWYWCKENRVHEFQRKDIKHIFNGDENVIAHWGDWVFFGGLVYKPAGKGTWGLNMERCSNFISGKLAIPTKAYKNPLEKTVRYSDERYINEIPHISNFLDKSKQYVVKYL